MGPGLAISLALAVVIGITLGALGGGGSVLTLPIFVLIAGIPTQQAVAMSMLVVGGTSLIGAVQHWRRGQFHLQATLLFATTGMAGAYAGSFLTPLASQQTIMGLFAGLMLFAGSAMVYFRPGRLERGQCRFWPCLLMGSVIGVLTGFLGVGGGFLVVPALVLLAGIETKAAIGTSLAVISLNAAAGLAGHLHSVSLDWWLTLSFFGLALIGMFGGLALAKNVHGESLSRAFGGFVIVVGLVIGGWIATGLNFIPKT